MTMLFNDKPEAVADPDVIIRDAVA
jgi:hypothetical protein